MKVIDVFVADLESPEAKAVMALLTFEGWSFDVFQDPQQVLKSTMGRASPINGVVVMYQGEVIGGFWSLAQWIQNKGLRQL